jgi:hypothetical protein
LAIELGEYKAKLNFGSIEAWLALIVFDYAGHLTAVRRRLIVRPDLQVGLIERHIRRNSGRAGTIGKIESAVNKSRVA